MIQCIGFLLESRCLFHDGPILTGRSLLHSVLLPCGMLLPSEVPLAGKIPWCQDMPSLRFRYVIFRSPHRLRRSAREHRGVGCRIPGSDRFHRFHFADATGSAAERTAQRKRYSCCCKEPLVHRVLQVICEPQADVLAAPGQNTRSRWRRPVIHIFQRLETFSGARLSRRSLGGWSWRSGSDHRCAQRRLLRHPAFGIGQLEREEMACSFEVGKSDALVR